MDREKFLQLTLEAEATLFHISFSILHDEQDCADAVKIPVGTVKSRLNRGRKKLKDYLD